MAVCSVDGVKKKRRYTSSDKADLDIRTSKNLIGDIINLAQELNSRIWDRIWRGDSVEDVQELYFDTCKLSILSGIEIDKAKKEFIIDSAKELSEIRRKNELRKDGKAVKPHFFAHISRQKGYYNPQKKIYMKHHTAMDYLQHCVNSYRNNKNGKSRKNNFMPFSSIVDQTDFDYSKVEDRQISKVLRRVHALNSAISAIYADVQLSKQEQHETAHSLRQDFIEELGMWDFNHDTVIALLHTIEKDENQKYRMLLFYTLFGYPNKAFYKSIIKSQGQIPVLENSSDKTDITIFDQYFTKNLQKRPKKT